VIVDWGAASAGVPAADVAWTILLFRYAGSSVGTPLPLRAVMALMKRIFLQIYLRGYSRPTGVSMKEIDTWLGNIAVLRLTDRMPKERAALLRLVRRRFEIEG